jgi:hypothetical protein
MSRRKWSLMWDYGRFAGAGYLDPNEIEHTYLLQYDAQPAWWPELVDYPTLDAIMPDTADESAIIEALKGLK